MSQELYDTRYPRPFWFRIGRRFVLILGRFAGGLAEILEEFPLGSILFLIITYIVWAVISFIVHGVTWGTLFTLHTLSELPLSDGTWWQSNWWKLLLILVGATTALITLLISAYSVEQDLKRERSELLERRQPPGFNLRYISPPDAGQISHMAWSPDGSVLALATDNGVSLWQPETGTVLCTIDAGRGKSMTWSPDGLRLATIDSYGELNLWDSQTGAKQRNYNFKVSSDYSLEYSIAWSPDGRALALALQDRNIDLVNIRTEQIVTLSNSSRAGEIVLAWSPDGEMLAELSGEDMQIWSTAAGRLLATYSEDFGYDSYSALAWSPNGRVLAGSAGGAISLWNPLTGQKIGSLEQASRTFSLSFSSDSRLLASKHEGYYRNQQAIIKLWRTDTWEMVATFDESHIYYGHNPILAFHPIKANVLATGGRRDTIARIWELDLSLLLGDAPAQAAYLPFPSRASQAAGGIAPLLSPPRAAKERPALSVAPAPSPVMAGKQEPAAVADISTIPLPSLPVLPHKKPPVPAIARYRNAKVVLVGDSGVGKSGLGLVLSNQPFVPTESTHGRRVWMFDSHEVELGGGRRETHETLLWDLAGQPGYRLIHQLHLNEVTVALVVFDARSETDPFAGVAHWVRALRMAQRAQGSAVLPLKKFLVAARMDRSGIGVSRARIENMLRESDFAGYFETSAKDGRGIAELKAAIQSAIDWETLPFVSSSILFQQIKDFLVAEKEAGRVLSTVDDLYRAFLRTASTPRDTEDLPAQFEICIGRVESRGLIRRLSFGNLVLLQPELLDAYASALINVVRDEPDGLGSISEERVLAANFAVPREERLKNREQEKVLMIAMIEDFLRYELALREQAEDGQYLVFPSQSTRENPNLPDPEGKAATLSFEGPVQNIYATLAIRLSHSGLFKKKDLWKNAITYTTQRGGTCGIFLQHTGDGQGSLTLFFDQAVSAERRADFEAYVVTHLQRKALPESIRRRRVVACRVCHTLVTEEAIQKRRALHFDWLACSVCDNRVSLLEQDEQLDVASSPNVQRMDEQADRARDLQAATCVVQGKQETKDFDVFLCHHGVDKPSVKRIGEQIKQQGLLPWLDEWELRPGLPWQQALEEQITNIKSAAVFVGQTGMGPWQSHEVRALLDQFVERSLPVIPVLLPDAPREPKLPLFLRDMTWVDFRIREPEPLQRLLWGITGNREYRPSL